MIFWKKECNHEWATNAFTIIMMRRAYLLPIYCLKCGKEIKEVKIICNKK